MFCGRENTPLPIIEPITSAVSRPSRNGFATALPLRPAGAGVEGAENESARFFMTDLTVLQIAGLGHFVKAWPLIWISPRKVAP
jgi:hypothetical protein